MYVYSYKCSCKVSDGIYSRRYDRHLNLNAFHSKNRLSKFSCSYWITFKTTTLEDMYFSIERIILISLSYLPKQVFRYQQNIWHYINYFEFFFYIKIWQYFLLIDLLKCVSAINNNNKFKNTRTAILTNIWYSLYTLK